MTMVRAWVAWWLVCAAIYLLLADNAALPELLTGAAAAIIGATGAVLVRRQRAEVLRPRIRPLLAGCARALASQLTDVVPLLRVLVTQGILRRPATGTLVEVAFHRGGDDQWGRTHRVLTAALGTVGPNTMVVEVDDARGVLLVHQLVPTPDPRRKAAPLDPR